VQKLKREGKKKEGKDRMHQIGCLFGTCTALEPRGN